MEISGGAGYVVWLGNIIIIIIYDTRIADVSIVCR